MRMCGKMNHACSEIHHSYQYTQIELFFVMETAPRCQIPNTKTKCVNNAGRGLSDTEIKRCFSSFFKFFQSKSLRSESVIQYHLRRNKKNKTVLFTFSCQQHNSKTNLELKPSHSKPPASSLGHSSFIEDRPTKSLAFVTSSLTSANSSTL